MSPPFPSGNTSLCSTFVAALPIQHVSISTLGAPFDIETICSSDPLAAWLDELQLDYGEGPCWQARATRAPVLVPDLRFSDRTNWPVLRAAVATHAIRSAYAFPLAVGPLDIGAVDLYAASPDALTESDIQEAVALADLAAIQVLQNALAHVDDPPDTESWPRRVVHQATGMVIAQLGVGAEDALLIIRAHAFAAGRSVRDVSADITAHRIDFTG